MANTYDAEAASAAPDNTAAPAGKQPQEAVNYRMGNPMRSCGLCGNFTGSAGDGAYACQTVDGEISPYGYCDIYVRQDNPFLAGEQYDYGDQGGGDAENPTEAVAPDEEADTGPALQIGNRRYGG